MGQFRQFIVSGLRHAPTPGTSEAGSLRPDLAGSGAGSNASGTSASGSAARQHPTTARQHARAAFAFADAVPAKAGAAAGRPVSDLKDKFSQSAGPRWFDLTPAQIAAIEKGSDQPVRFSQAVRDAYPQCLAASDHHVVVEGPDGKPRRFPVDTSLHLTIKNGFEDGLPAFIGKRVVGQLDTIDAHRDAVHASIAEFEFDPGTAGLTYAVGGKTVPSLLPDKDVFPLPDGKWMVPQPKSRDCTFACEKMMLLEGKSPSEASALMQDFRRTGTGRMLEHAVASIERSSGRTPVVLERTSTAEAAVAELKQALEAYGPCILNMNGHARVLDAIDTTETGHVFSIRDPFTGSSLKIKDHEQFWAPLESGLDRSVPRVTPTDGTTERRWDAIFLKD